MTRSQMCACDDRITNSKRVLTSLVWSINGNNSLKENDFLGNVLGSDSWTLSHIMPGVMRHDNPTEENRENATQIEQLQNTSNKPSWLLLLHTTFFFQVKQTQEKKKNSEEERKNFRRCSYKKLTSASIYERYAMSIIRATSRSVECLYTEN